MLLKIFPIISLVFVLAPPTQAAPVTFLSTGTVTSEFHPGAEWIDDAHPILGETFSRVLSIDDTAPPFSISRLKNDYVDPITAKFTANETWLFDSSNIGTTEDVTLNLNLNNISGRVELTYDSLHFASFLDKTEDRAFQSDPTATEVIYLLAQGPVFRNGTLYNHGEAHHWIGGCIKTMYNGRCGIEYETIFSGLEDPDYIPTKPISFTEQRPLVSAVPLPATLPLMLSLTAALSALGLRASRPNGVVGPDPRHKSGHHTQIL